jgi:hypothetical protein
MLNRIAVALGVTVTDQDEVLNDILPKPASSVEELDGICQKISTNKEFRKKLVSG